MVRQFRLACAGFSISFELEPGGVLNQKTVAIHTIDGGKPLYRRLIAAGKPAKVAITACSRKLLTILDAMAHSKQPWKELPA